MRLHLINLGAIALLALISNVHAHHSHGNYQMTEYTHLEGIVQEMHWINPFTLLKPLFFEGLQSVDSALARYLSSPAKSE